MIIHYCSSFEEALRRAKAAGKVPGCHYGGIVLPSGKKGFAIYRDSKVIEQYTSMQRRDVHTKQEDCALFTVHHPLY